MRPLLALLALLPAASAPAALTVYETRAAFNAAVGTPTIETLDAYAVDTPFHTTPVDVGPFTFSMTGSPDTTSIRNKIDVPPSEFSSDFNVDGTPVANVLTTPSADFFITFDTPIRAFGFDAGSLNDGILRTQIIVDSTTLTPSVASSVRFYGFTSDTFFTTIQFDAVQNDGYGLDNLTFSTVPEPGSAMLLAMGALGLGLRRRRGVLA